jgi:hypothetical protein
VALVHAEAGEVFRGDDSLLISLGTGLASNVRFDPSIRSIHSDLVAIATDTERAAHDFERRDNARAVLSNRYFRFSVPGIGDIGLEEAKELNAIREATNAYLALPVVGREQRTCAQELAEGELVLPEAPVIESSEASASQEEFQERLDRLRSQQN